MCRFLILALFFVCFRVSAADCDIYQFSDFAGCIKSNTNAILKADIVLSPNQTIEIKGVTNFSFDGYSGGIKHKIDESSARFTTNNSQSGSYIRIENSTDITIKNVMLRSTPASDNHCAYPGVYYNSNPCFGLILARNSTGVDFLGNEFTARKTFQLQLIDASSILISNNAFSNAATFGVWMSGYSGNVRAIQITDNTFSGAGANAIIISDADGMWVGNNDFINNHRLTQYSGYGGGQIVFEESPRFSTKNVDVTGNLFIANTVTTSNGVEFANFDLGKSIENIRVIWNRLEGNGQGAVVFDNSNNSSQVNNVEISNNEFISNGSSYKGQSIYKSYGSLKIANNWIESTTTRVQASFDGTAETCTLAPGQSICTVDIKWNVLLTRGGTLRVTTRRPATLVGDKNRGNFAGYIDKSGHQLAPWIGTDGTVFELYFDSDYAQQNGWEAPIASITVRAVPAP